jgi:hypothetical protein
MMEKTVYQMQCKVVRRGATGYCLTLKQDHVLLYPKLKIGNWYNVGVEVEDDKKAVRITDDIAEQEFEQQDDGTPQSPSGR